MSSDLYQLQAEVCKAIAHPTRIEILQLLREGERCVCEIFPAMKIEKPNVSRHLSVLKKAGILSSRKEGLKVIYMVNDQRIYQALELITDILREQLNSKQNVLR